MAGTSEKWKRLQDATLKLGFVNDPKLWSFYLSAIMLTLVLWLQVLFETTKEWLCLVDQSDSFSLQCKLGICPWAVRG